jgi:hypothetical protein
MPKHKTNPGRAPRSLTKDVVPVIEEFTSDYAIDMSRGGHLAVTLRRGAQVVKVFHSATASDPRAIKNFRMQVKRAVASLVEQEGSLA